MNYKHMVSQLEYVNKMTNNIYFDQKAETYLAFDADGNLMIETPDFAIAHAMWSSSTYSDRKGEDPDPPQVDQEEEDKAWLDGLEQAAMLKELENEQTDLEIENHITNMYGYYEDYSIINPADDPEDYVYDNWLKVDPKWTIDELAYFISESIKSSIVIWLNANNPVDL